LTTLESAANRYMSHPIHEQSLVNDPTSKFYCFLTSDNYCGPVHPLLFPAGKRRDTSNFCRVVYWLPLICIIDCRPTICLFVSTSTTLYTSIRRPGPIRNCMLITRHAVASHAMDAICHCSNTDKVHGLLTRSIALYILLKCNTTRSYSKLRVPAVV
jgi:hypothetical protein